MTKLPFPLPHLREEFGREEGGGPARPPPRVEGWGASSLLPPPLGWERCGATASSLLPPPLSGFDSLRDD